MARNLLAVSNYPSVPPNRVLNKLVTTENGAVVHALLSTHRWPSDESYVLVVSQGMERIKLC